MSLESSEFQRSLPVQSKPNIRLDDSWLKYLQSEFSQPYMIAIKKFLQEEIQKGKTIYPRGGEIFAALNHTPFEKVRVVILGQDPYHGEGQAHGLCFSVRPGVRPPPSLQNIFKELNTDIGMATPKSGNLEGWADQGVLLLNAVLTVERDRAASHQGRGWERFTDKIVSVLNERRRDLVFMLWGSYAQNKGAIIDRNRHLVLSTVHPSPLSAHRGFLGCGHFSAANRYLVAKGFEPIDWAKL